MFFTKKHFIFSLLMIASIAPASEHPTTKALTTNATLLMTHQSLLHSENRQEGQFSIDVEFDYSSENRGWFTWFEYSSTPANDGISQTFDGSNSDVGTTQNAAGNGRIQLSSLYYYDEQEHAPIHWLAGITQVSALIDTTEVANDEVEQFLSGSLLNNTTIAFPDYTLSARVRFREFSQNSELVLLLANSQGLADKNGNYAEAWQPFRSEFGVFSAVELIHHYGNATISNGLWLNTTSQSRGWYHSTDIDMNAAVLNIRLGIADIHEPHHPTVTPEAQDDTFISFALKYPFLNGLFAAGWSHAKTNVTDIPATQIAETYYRYAVSETLYITPSLQWRKRQNITPEKPQDVWIAGIRLQQDL